VKLFRGTEKEKPELYRKASPISHISKNDPPLLLVHGENDDLVPFDRSIHMADAYRQAGLPVEFIAGKTQDTISNIGDALFHPQSKPSIKGLSTSSSVT
jgi:acetyl esterase/lipase